jgi:hypothetical protein
MMNLFHWGLPHMSEQIGDPENRDRNKVEIPTIRTVAKRGSRPSGIFCYELKAISYVYPACPVEPGTLRVFNWGEIAKQRFKNEPISLGSCQLFAARTGPMLVELFLRLFVWRPTGNPVAPLGSTDSLRELLNLVARHPGHNPDHNPEHKKSGRD